MKLPIELFINGIDEKKVYYFSSTQLDTSIPLYFICIIKAENDKLILVCCTSDREGKRKKLAEKRGWYSTLVYVVPNADNGLTKDTFVDCNNVFTYSIDDFANMYNDNLLEFKGEISDIPYEQIMNGMLDSPLIEEDIKELIRNK